MKQWLTKCLAKAKGCFDSPDADLKVRLAIAEAELEAARLVARNARLNESLLAKRVGRFQADHPGLHREYFSAKPPKRKAKA